MSTATLALLIGALILAQVAAALFLGMYRRQAERRALGTSGPGPGSGIGVTLRPGADRPGPRPAPVARTPGSPPAAWSGYRDFVVQRRVVEDLGGSVRSFYLAPADGGPLPPYKPGQYLTFNLEVPDPAGRPGPIAGALLFALGPRAPGRLPDHRQARPRPARPAGACPGGGVQPLPRPHRRGCEGLGQGALRPLPSDRGQATYPSC